LRKGDNFSLHREEKPAMPTAEIKRDAEISLHMSLTREQREAVLRAAELETGGDIAGFVASAAIKAAKGALMTDESCRHILLIGGK
jgi:uncharacterized protein (DUF1778 family)